ncbi:hypothetical protein CCP1ISM_9890001 [Azospirillaceae bacterium]
MPKIANMAREFSEFSASQIELIKSYEIVDILKACQIVTNALEKSYDVQYSKGLSRLCSGFLYPCICEMRIIERINDDNFRKTMDRIYDAVK